MLRFIITAGAKKGVDANQEWCPHDVEAVRKAMNVLFSFFRLPTISEIRLNENVFKIMCIRS
jgi:hypothetical protein